MGDALGNLTPFFTYSSVWGPGVGLLIVSDPESVKQVLKLDPPKGDYLIYITIIGVIYTFMYPWLGLGLLTKFVEPALMQ
jgi:hypothetical protein